MTAISANAQANNAIPIPHQLYRIPCLILGALAVTVLILLLMERLVHNDMLAPPEQGPHKINTVVMDPPGPPEILPPPFVRPEPVEPPPEMPPITQTIAKNVDFTIDLTPPSHSEKISHNHSGPTDSTAIPIVRIAPDYPNRMATRGIEGYVDLIFDISTAGVPTNIRVTESEPEGAFDKAAIRALARWKYRPKQVDGYPVTQTGQQTRIRFDLSD
ncbi:energy transducer TonB [Zhongshania aquimaris]|uniref:Energy transducer TonB n=1 Tax=Zhongshania aquimaris TaxID=2857107 RepID=A0ABS6VRA8_9GAMM|nr:energy transducer TonB [Zhongshania aquimaris]MBW2940574.1 energy transducer TonB [Zhongshania aquimaris]